jgi:hypothetical protein
MSPNWDALVAEAQQRLRDQDEENQNDDLGDAMRPEPEEYVQGRWRGTGVLHGKERDSDVYLIWDREGRRGFLWQDAGLVKEVERENPQVGDEFVVLRGPTHEFEQDGEQRKKYPYALTCRPSTEPLPEPVPGTAPTDDDLPF